MLRLRKRFLGCKRAAAFSCGRVPRETAALSELANDSLEKEKDAAAASILCCFIPNRLLTCLMIDSTHACCRVHGPGGD
jgi:hypothetical protein